jgi:two-component system, OmpR family, alkaline phosphatase synthesis response regulator PhoP
VARIMIVDDERDVVTLLKFLLEKDGHEVLTAHNGAEALKQLGIEPSASPVPLDLLISDVLMPVMDGYTLCLRLREDAKSRSIPVIVLTAKGDTRNVFQVLPNVGATIDKPFDPKKLRELVASMVQAQAR